MPHVERFGFLSRELDFAFNGGEVSTLKGFVNYFEVYEHNPFRANTFYSPPGWDPLRNPLYLLPLSHELRLELKADKEQIRNGAASFIVYLLGYLTGLWLQLEGWFVDRPVPGKRTHGVWVDPSTAGDFISWCFEVWRQWPFAAQRASINMLFMHARAPTYAWDWEHFTMEYLTADACYRLACKTADPKNRVPNCSHDERLRVLCDRFGIPQNEDLLSAFAKLRNDLFHEALWAGRSTTGSAFEVYDWAKLYPGELFAPYRAAIWLRKLNVRLIAAVFGYGRPHRMPEWWGHLTEGGFVQRSKQGQ